MPQVEHAFIAHKEAVQHLGHIGRGWLADGLAFLAGLVALVLHALDGLLNAGLHGLKPLCHVAVVEVRQAIGQAFRPGGHALHGLGRLQGLFLAWVAACAGLGALVVVAAHDQQGSRPQAPHSLCHVRQVARVEGDAYRVPGCFVQAGTRGEAFTQQQHPGPAGLAYPVHEASFAATLEKALIRPAGGLLRCNPLQVPQRPAFIAHGHQ